jgi:hypothetical protein
MRTFKLRNGDEVETAAFSAFMNLSREEIEVAERLAKEEGVSVREWIKQVASTAVKECIAASRASTQP